MCKIMEESNREAVKQNSYRIAMNFIRMGVGTEEDIAKATNLTLEEVQALAEIVKASA